MRTQLKAIWAYGLHCPVQSQLLNTLPLKRVFCLKNRKFGVSSCYQNEITEKNNIENKSKSPKSKNDSQPAVTEDNLPDMSENDKKTIDSLKKGNIYYPYKSPHERVTKILLNDMKVELNKFFYSLTRVKMGDLEVKFFPRHTDVVIVGCGIIGLSVAYAMKSEFPHGVNIIVVDKDENSPFSKSNIGIGNILQQQFTDEKEIEMTKYFAEFLYSFHRHTLMPGHEGFHVSYEPLGSLILGFESNAQDLLVKHETLKMHEVHTRILGLKTLKNKFPWLNLNNVVLGLLGMQNEGLIEPQQVLFGMKMKLINLGVQFITAEVIDFGVNDQKITRVICKLPDKTHNSIDFGKCVIAAGLGSGKLLKIINDLKDVPLQIRIPFEEKRRYEYCFHNPDGPGLNAPIIINSDGTYFRREGLSGLYVAGVQNITSSHDEESVYEVFNTKVKPFLETRFDNFKEVKVQNGWMNSYDSNSANELGVIGFHPCNREILFAFGFTKSGLAYGPAVGRALMELLFYNRYKTIDLTLYQVENLYHKEHLEAERKNKKLAEAQQRISISE